MRNIQYLTIDINKKTQQDVTANEGEIGSRFLKIKITDSNVPVDLTGAKVYLYALKSDNTKLFNLVEIVEATQGVVLAELTSQLLTSAGVVKLTLVLTEGTKKLISKEFTLKVDDSIFDDDAIASTNEFTALTTALGQVQNIDNRFNVVSEQFITKASVTYVNNKVSQLVNGSPKGTYANLSVLQSEKPNGDVGVYITLDNNNWCYWNGTQWLSGGIYQSNGIGNKSIQENHVGFLNCSVAKLNEFVDYNVSGDYVNISDLIPVNCSVQFNGSDIQGKQTAGTSYGYFKIDKVGVTNKFKCYKINYLLIGEDSDYVYGINLGDLVPANLGYVFKFAKATGNAIKLKDPLALFSNLSQISVNDVLSVTYVGNILKLTKNNTDWFDYDIDTLGVNFTKVIGIRVDSATFSNFIGSVSYGKSIYLEKEKLLNDRLLSVENKINNSTNVSSIKSLHYDKKLLTIGDSITFAGKYQPVIQETLGLSTVYNRGRNGSPIDGMAQIVAQYEADADIVLVFGGTNDFQLDYKLGEVGEQATISNSMDWLCRQLIDKYPTKPIIYCTPLQRWGYTNASVNGGKPTTMTNNNDVTLEQIANKLKSIAEGYGIKVLDLYHTSGFNPRNINQLTSDGLHPNDLGYGKIGKQIAMFLNTCY